MNIVLQVGAQVVSCSFFSSDCDFIGSLEKINQNEDLVIFQLVSSQTLTLLVVLYFIHFK